MRVTGIQAQELFSFDRLRLGGLPQTLVVVGPNGAGKTNLLRLLQVIEAGLDRAAGFSDPAYQSLMRFAASRRIGADLAVPSGVRLEIALTEPDERELLTRFVRGAVASSLLQGAPPGTDVAATIRWVRENVTDTLLNPLASGTVFVEFAETSAERWTVGYEFDAAGQQFRWVLDGVPSRGAILGAADAGRQEVPGYSLSMKLPLDERRVPAQPLTLAALLPPPGESRMLTLDASPQVTELTSEFVQRAGITDERAQRQNNYSLANVLQTILGRGLMLLADLRQPPQTTYTASDLSADPSTADGSRIPVQLFRLKNGNPSERRKYAEIRDLFRRLTGRSFEVALAATPRTDDEDPEAGLQISVLLEQDGRDLPIEYAGAGYWEALLLSAVLPQSAGQVAVLDEPGRNLHPTLQRRLVAEMRRAPGQFLVATHSPYLVTIHESADLAGITRFTTHNGATLARRLPTAPEPGSARLLKALGESADARALLFARWVVLVEGGTELGALPEWFTKSATAGRLGTPDTLNIAIFSVDGDRNFGTYVAFLHALTIPWAIVCDGAVYKFGTGRKQIFEQVTGAGIQNQPMTQAVSQAAAGNPGCFTELRQIGEDNGIFTLAEDWASPAEGFEAYAESIAPGLLARAASIVGPSKPRQGRYAAAETSCPPDVDALYSKLLQTLSRD